MLSPDVEHVLSIQKNRSKRVDDLKQKILLSVKEKINNYAKFGQTNCIYTVPNFIIGEIPYNVEKVSKFIGKKLKTEGFYIIKISEHYIYISWNINDISKNNTKSKSVTNNNDNYTAFTNKTKTF